MNIEDNFKSDIILCKNDEGYFISNVNYIESNKEEMFKIINNNKFSFKKIISPQILNHTTFSISNIIDLKFEGNSINTIEFLNEAQKLSLESFYLDTKFEDEKYYLLKLKIKNNDSKEHLRRISFNSKIQDESIISDVYNNILNIQNVDYFNFVNSIIFITNNVFFNEIDLVEFNEKKISFDIVFQSITKQVPSFFKGDGSIDLKSNISILVLIIDKENI